MNTNCSLYNYLVKCSIYHFFVWQVLLLYVTYYIAPHHKRIRELISLNKKKRFLPFVSKNGFYFVISLYFLRKKIPRGVLTRPKNGITFDKKVYLSYTNRFLYIEHYL